MAVPLTLCDLTQSYAATGGGIRTYVHAKRAWLDANTDVGHVLIVPGPEDAVEHEGRHVTHFVQSPPVPGSSAYRLLLRNGRVRELLGAERPDAVECLCAYNLPWAALRHQREVDPSCAVVGGYRTDFPSAYVEPLVGGVLGEWAGRHAAALGYRYVARLYARFDAVYTLSPTPREKLAELGVDSELLPLGVDLERFHPRWRDPQLRAALGVGAGSPLLVYAGRLDAEKRPLEVLDAFRQLPPALGAHLALAGDGPQRAEIEAATARDPRVHVLGFVADRDRYARILASADVYVSAMPHETFGISVVEAQASGLPVVGVRSGAMPDRVPPGLGHLSPAGDPAALAAGVEAVLADGSGIRRRARAYVAARFSWDETFQRLLALYDRVLTDRRVGAPADAPQASR
ncbi:glycosyltransferase [Rubrivirga sp. S365]|uniref:Glycosyltransferase n=1 Tax=Rubrivirga litoralis TaxID=3075598 RepID=A0ABU3BVC0_9BACT|nr:MULTISPECIES: glycosyltransferase [unclassified Rubrivirga]MDT0633241.1 glycosyltransferase [Rubrivirga sp. F394]MDT7857807.1 glycosyltransferase [Rubrivirga sp. S365]